MTTLVASSSTARRNLYAAPRSRPAASAAATTYRPMTLSDAGSPGRISGSTRVSPPVRSINHRDAVVEAGLLQRVLHHRLRAVEGDVHPGAHLLLGVDQHPQPGRSHVLQPAQVEDD